MEIESNEREIATLYTGTPGILLKGHINRKFTN
jgi:hypothetical protein